MKWRKQYEGPFLVVRTPSSVTAEIQKSAKTHAKVVHVDKPKEYLGKPPKSWLAAAQAGIDEVSQIGEAGASAERTTRSTSDDEDNSEEPDEVDRMSPTIGDRYEESDEAIRVKSPEVEKSSSGRVTAEAKSSSDNVSEGAGGRVEKSSSGRVTAEAKSSSDNVSEGASEEQLADNEVLSFDKALPEEAEGSYEADEKPERGRPRKQIQTPRKYRDFVVNSAKNRRIRTTKMEGMTRPRPEATLRNEKVVKRRPTQFRNEEKTRNESASVNKDTTAKSIRILQQTRIEMDRSEIASTSQSTSAARPERIIQEARPLPPTLPKTDVRRRRIVITAARLAKAASENPSKSTKELAEELADECSLMPEERRKCLHQLRGMLVAQRHLCSRIRKAFPMTRGTEEREAFLGWLQKTLKEVEDRESDELQ